MANNGSVTPSQFLGPQGPVAQNMPAFELRPQQIQLSSAIANALSKRHHLIAEAGTGIGKSFAYLIPAAQWATQQKKKILISTYTISLQEQLIQKDLPFLKPLLDPDLKIALAKGRANYLCIQRLQQAQRRGLTLFDSEDQLIQLDQLQQWALQTHDGSLSSIPILPHRAVWDTICSDHTICAGKNCPHYESCFYQKARRRLISADLIIANHAILFSDLALRQQGSKVLPDYKSIIIDEAHNIEQVAGQHFGLHLSNFQLAFLLNRLLNPRTQKGLLAAFQDQATLTQIADAHEASHLFFQEIQNLYRLQQTRGQNGRITEPDTTPNTLSQPLSQLAQHLIKLADPVDHEVLSHQQLELLAYAQRCREFADTVHIFLRQGIPDSVYWLEASARLTNPRIVISAAPIHLGPTLKKALWDPFDSVILTSATLSTIAPPETQSDKKVKIQKDAAIAKGFEFLASRLQLENENIKSDPKTAKNCDSHGANGQNKNSGIGCKYLQLDSPFNYPQQVTLYLHADMPDPRDQEPEFLASAIQAIQHHLLETNGKAFILCTNYKHLNHIATALEDFAQRHDLTLLAQGQDIDRTTLLNQFRQDTNSILLGTDSFWQGVDVPGPSLSNVIIVKLPFAVPDHPLLQARLEQIKNQGHSPFFSYQLPQAVLKFKQGFGRLIRSHTDRGIIVVLDPRIVTKKYGHAFLKTLPTCPTHIIHKKNPEDPENFPQEMD